MKVKRVKFLISLMIFALLTGLLLLCIEKKEEKPKQDVAETAVIPESTKVSEKTPETTTVDTLLPTSITNKVKGYLEVLKEEEQEIKALMPEAQSNFEVIQKIARQPLVREFLKKGGRLRIKDLVIKWYHEEVEVITRKYSVIGITEITPTSNPHDIKTLAKLTPEIIRQKIRAEKGELLLTEDP